MLLPTDVRVNGPSDVGMGKVPAVTMLAPTVGSIKPRPYRPVPKALLEVAQILAGEKGLLDPLVLIKPAAPPLALNAVV